MREFKGDWRDLFFGFRIALDLRKIFLALVGSIFSVAGLLLIFYMGAQAEYGKHFSDMLLEGEISDATFVAGNWAKAQYVTPVLDLVRPVREGRPGKNEVPGEKGVSFKNCPAYGLMVPTPIDKNHPPMRIWPLLILLAACLWLIFVWSKFGGAISRIAAVEVAKDERITTHEAMLYAKKKYSSYFWSPVSVLIAFLFFFFVNALGGLVGQIPYAGPLLVGLLSIFAFLGGFIMLLIAIGGIFGWPLMAPAVAAEGTDAFDAVSRAFSYIYSRPWQYAWYWLVSIVYGAVSVGFVWFFTALMVNLTFKSAQFGMGSKLNGTIFTLFSGSIFKDLSTDTNLNFAQIIMTVILSVIVIFLYGLAASYMLSFCYTTRTLMYFILRKRVDNTEMTEVFLEEDEEDLFEDDFDLGDEKKEGDECKETPEGGEEKKEDGGGEPSESTAKPPEDSPPAPADGGGGEGSQEEKKGEEGPA